MSDAALAELIRSAGTVVALTGAGISVPSGIPDFRSPGTGLWENVDPMEVAHIDVFRRDPERFWRFYGARFAALEEYVISRAIELPILTVLTPLPGTQLHAELQERITIRDLDYYTLTNAVMPTRLGEKRFYQQYARLIKLFHANAKL